MHSESIPTHTLNCIVDTTIVHKADDSGGPLGIYCRQCSRLKQPNGAYKYDYVGVAPIICKTTGFHCTTWSHHDNTASHNHGGSVDRQFTTQLSKHVYSMHAMGSTCSPHQFQMPLPLGKLGKTHLVFPGPGHPWGAKVCGSPGPPPTFD